MGMNLNKHKNRSSMDQQMDLSNQTSMYGNRKIFCGTVRNMQIQFGFIEAEGFDEDIFFQTETVIGMIPKNDEKVIGEAIYISSMTFKWNAVRVQMFSPLMKFDTHPT